MEDVGESWACCKCARHPYASGDFLLCLALPCSALPFNSLPRSLSLCLTIPHKRAKWVQLLVLRASLCEGNGDAKKNGAGTYIALPVYMFRTVLCFYVYFCRLVYILKSSCFTEIVARRVTESSMFRKSPFDCCFYSTVPHCTVYYNRNGDLVERWPSPMLYSRCYCSFSTRDERVLDLSQTQRLSFM